MFGKCLLGGGQLVFLTSCLGALATACLDRPLCGDCNPETTNQFVMQVPTGGINKIDLLFMIDNSASMADKQKLLRAAVPSLLSRFVSPLCVDEHGEPTGAQFVDGRCASGVPEFSPIGDIHIGVISSSLGVPGGIKNCPRTFEGSDKPTTRDDRGWLLPKAPSRIRNSPTKPFIPGNATEARVTSRNAATSFGVTLFSPPNSEIVRVCRRSESMPTMRKSPPVETPCASI